ncbi:hypothetical protein B5D80_20200 [Micromonospora wenchangensis]|uniref:Uncharacterized protein n=1 Tax=Micromonospora wenchangensis TaxID=1185415 RepID=A0A246RIT3_9ACTN|nr:hypothetical protein B5D80_20200 [Micromonospora wenchangensis]
MTGAETDDTADALRVGGVSIPERTGRPSGRGCGVGGTFGGARPLACGASTALVRSGGQVGEGPAGGVPRRRPDQGPASRPGPSDVAGTSTVLIRDGGRSRPPRLRPATGFRLAQDQ